jgi:hypothetical protein
MTIITSSITLAVCVTMVHAKPVEKPFGTSSSFPSEPGLLYRQDSALHLANHSSTSDQQSVQIAGIDWDTSNTLDDSSWQRFKGKGNMFYCLMDMSDSVAGVQWPDPFKRVPPSASSPWKGTLEGMFLTLCIEYNHMLTLISRQMNWQLGVGSKANTTRM